jgi:hypothetical protein
MRAAHHRPSRGLAHRPDLSRKKSRSMMSCPTFSCRADICALAAASLPIAFLSPSNRPLTPSCTAFFQAWIWLACTPYLLESSAIVLSSRIAAIATFALNSALCFFRMLVISNPLAPCRFRGETLLATCPVFWAHLTVPTKLVGLEFLALYELSTFPKQVH